MKEEKIKIIVNGEEKLKLKITLDEMDEDIIKMLQKDAKTSYREIKEELGIST
ncbi:MAG: AsnC family transcriptional regulator [Promethearchaeota archaeon]